MVTVDLALNVSAANGNTRMASDVVKATSLSDVTLNFSVLPFIIPSSQDTITADDAPLTEPITTFSAEQKHYLSSQVELSIGTNAFLCYANMNRGTSYDRSTNGSLQASGTGLSTTFDWEHIQQPSTVPNADAVKILECLNAIASVEYSNGSEQEHWNTSINEEWIGLFNRFVNNSQSIAGSSRNIIAYVNYWYHEANTIADPLKTAIKNAISANFTVEGDQVTAINDVTSYPAGLPDGNAVIKWNNNPTAKKFEYDEIKWDADKNAYYYLSDNDKFVNYVYPAERYFYANSRIKTSTSSQKDNYTASRWAEKAETTDEYGVLDYYDDANIVASTTRSVAIKNPLSYGVAGLEIHIKANTSSEINYLRDANPEYTQQEVTLGNETFPLTAIIVGSQVKQNCFFEPVISDNKDENLIYDTNVTACLGATDKDTYSAPIYTLGMQTKDGVSMKVVLEFKNNSDKDFISEDGIIYRNTKFYMVASVVPPTNEGIGKRVMTRGHMTVVNLTIKSLKSAYNALPDLRSDKLRLFDVVEAGIRNWQTGQTGEHEFFNW